MDWRKLLRGIGKTFITSGVLILLFVAYQLWGTGLAEARSQHSLQRAIECQLQPKLARCQKKAPATTSSTSPPSSTPAVGTPAVTAPPTTTDPPPLAGDAIAIIDIKKIGVHKAVVEGVDLSELKKGPGHYPGTPMPGQPGNASIAGHRTTYGAPFFRLDELSPGDPIVVTTRQGQFTYNVTTSQAVSPNDVAVVDPTPDNRLTLTTCTPRFTASQRLVVTAALAPEQQTAPAPVALVPVEGSPPAPKAVLPGDKDPGLKGDHKAELPTLAWAIIAFAVGLLLWELGRRWKRWAVYLLGSPLMIVALFILFENVNRLLPANV